MRAIAMAAYRVYIARIGGRPAPMRADYQAIASAGGGHVARIEHRIVGFVVIACRPRALHIDNLAVHPEHGGRGVGTALLSFAEDRAVALGLPRTRLYTNALMHENRAWYARCGYVETARRKQAGYDRVFMEKTLK